MGTAQVIVVGAEAAAGRVLGEDRAARDTRTHVNALLLQARRRAYIGGSMGRYGGGGKHKA